MRTLIAIAILLLAACQSYQPLPLDEAAHLRAWQARDADSQSVREFARDLARRDAAPRAAFNAQDGVDLQEAEVIALFFNANLKRARLDAGAALLNAQTAGAWENPELNISGGLILASIAHPWQAAAALEFTIPLSGRKGVEKDLAFAEHKVKWRETLKLEWETLIELRRKWRELAATQLHAELLRAHIADVSETGGLADKLAQANELGRTDARVFAIELALVRVELGELESRLEEQRIEVKALLGLMPRAPVTLMPDLQAANSRLENDRESVARKNSPALALSRAEYEVAEQNLRLEIRKQYPDLRIGPGYEIEEGQSTITLGFGIPIPIINLNKQGIANARGKRLASKAAFEAEIEKLVSGLALAELRYQRAQNTRRVVEETLAPLVDLQIKETQERNKADFDALLTLEAFKTRREGKERVVNALLEEALALDEINGLLGPTFAPEEERK